MYRLLTTLTLVGLLAGCSTLEFPWVYRIDIEQGNIIEQETVDQLRPGMSRSQVEYVMGTALLQDTFNNDRWDYVYTLRRGSDGKKTREQLTVFFEGDQLTRLVGTYRPGGSADPA